MNKKIEALLVHGAPYRFKEGHMPTNGFDLRPPVAEKHWNWKGGKETLKERKREHDRKWREKAKNTPIFIEKEKLRRQRIKAMRKSAGQLSTKTIQLVYEDNIKKYGTLTCYLCLKAIEFGKDHLEHKFPIGRGGTNEYNNLAVACEKCNRSKNRKTEQEFREELQNVR